MHRKDAFILFITQRKSSRDNLFFLYLATNAQADNTEQHQYKQQ